MAKVKLGDLREIEKDFNKNNIKTITYGGEFEIEIKQYIPISDKVSMAKSIFDSAINRDSDLFILDRNYLDIAYRVIVVQNYTNLRLPKDSVEAYDLLNKIGLYQFIEESIPTSELTDLTTILENIISKEKDIYEQNNNVINVIKNTINNLMENLPDEDKMNEIMSSIKDNMDGFDLGKLNFIQDALKFNKGENIG